MCQLYDEAYHMLMDYIAHSIYVTEPDVPNSKRDRKIRSFGKYEITKLNLY
jgi:hypothetical protein